MQDKPSILGVFAHPDDECYGPGGTLALYALEGHPVHILTFTRGESGSLGSSRLFRRNDLACRREEELADACRVLGLAGHRIVGAPDGAVEGIGLERGVGEVLEEILRVRPEILITFDEKGISGHPDHRAVTRFARIAFLRAGDDGPERIAEFGILSEAAARLSPGRKKPVIPLEEDRFEARVRIPEEAMERKIEAIRRHRTQTAFYRQLRRAFGDYREATRWEHFRLPFERRKTGASFEEALLVERSGNPLPYYDGLFPSSSPAGGGEFPLRRRSR